MYKCDGTLSLQIQYNNNEIDIKDKSKNSIFFINNFGN